MALRPAPRSREIPEPGGHLEHPSREPRARVLGHPTSDKELDSATWDEPRPKDNSSDGEEYMHQSEHSDHVHYPHACEPRDNPRQTTNWELVERLGGYMAHLQDMLNQAVPDREGLKETQTQIGHAVATHYQLFTEQLGEVTQEIQTLPTWANNFSANSEMPKLRTMSR